MKRGTEGIKFKAGGGGKAALKGKGKPARPHRISDERRRREGVGVERREETGQGAGPKPCD